MPLRYIAYLAIVAAVLLDLFSAKPDATTLTRLSLDAVALLLAVFGLGGIAFGPNRIPRRY